MNSQQRSAILEILADAKDLTLATLRPDGWPQATTVSFVNDGLDLYFGTDAATQKSANITHDSRVSATITLPYTAWNEIRALSLAAHAERVTDPRAVARVGGLVLAKFPQVGAYVAIDSLEGLAVFRLKPVVFSLLDYRKGFGCTELIEA